MLVKARIKQGDEAAAKAQIDAPNYAGQTPLDVAKKEGRKEVADFLLNKVRAANKKVQGGML